MPGTRKLGKTTDQRMAMLRQQAFPSAVLSANMNFVTFIRNETKMTSIRDKNGRFVTNLITNFWLIVIVLKVTNGGIYHE